MEVKYIRNTLSGADGLAYREFVASASGTHYLQAANWAPVAAQPGLAQRYLLVRDRGRMIGAARLLRRMHGLVPSPSAVMERGPVVNDVSDLHNVLPAMLRAIRWHGIERLRIQPYFAGAEGVAACAAAAMQGFTASTDLDGPHTASLRLHLKGLSSQELFAGRQHNDLRREARKATSKGQRVRSGEPHDLQALANLYKTMMDAQGGNDRALEYFLAFESLLTSNDAALFVGENAGELDSSVLVVRQPGRSTFHLGASSATHRSYKKALLPLTKAIEWAHALGDECFDMGGVPGLSDNDPKRNNISNFKFHFASERIELAPVMYSPETRASRLLGILKAGVNKARNLSMVGLLVLCSKLVPLSDTAFASQC